MYSQYLYYSWPLKIVLEYIFVNILQFCHVYILDELSRLSLMRVKFRKQIAIIVVRGYYVKIHKIRHQCKGGTEYHKGLQGVYNSSEADFEGLTMIHFLLKWEF